MTLPIKITMKEAEAKIKKLEKDIEWLECALGESGDYYDETSLDYPPEDIGIILKTALEKRKKAHEQLKDAIDRLNSTRLIDYDISDEIMTVEK